MAIAQTFGLHDDPVPGIINIGEAERFKLAGKGHPASQYRRCSQFPRFAAKAGPGRFNHRREAIDVITDEQPRSAASLRFKVRGGLLDHVKSVSP